MMPSQRAWDAEIQVRNKLSNGPLRVQSNVSNHRVFCNAWACVSCRGYVGILLSAWGRAHEFKVAPRIVFVLFVLDRKYISVKDFFSFKNKNKEVLP